MINATSGVPSSLLKAFKIVPVQPVFVEIVFNLSAHEFFPEVLADFLRPEEPDRRLPWKIKQILKKISAFDEIHLSGFQSNGIIDALASLKVRAFVGI